MLILGIIAWTVLFTTFVLGGLLMILIGILNYTQGRNIIRECNEFNKQKS